MKQMKNSLMALILGVVSVGAASVSFADSKSSQLVPIDAARIFVPTGFDDNDNTQIVLDGYLPSGCYRLARPLLTVDENTRTIRVQAMARYFDIPCVEARIPFQLEVDIGLLPVGTFTAFTSKDTIFQNFTVREALTAGPDDFTFAPVDHIQIKTLPSDNSKIAVIEGRFTSSCMEMKEVKLIDSGATLEVLPIVTTTGDICADVLVPYRQVVELPKEISTGRHLLHVRSLNGHAMNYVFDVRE